MKAAKLISILLLLVCTCNGQNYYHFINSSKFWKCASEVYFTTRSNSQKAGNLVLEIYYFSEDTLISGLLYKKAYIMNVNSTNGDTTTHISPYYFYEDTISKKLYMYEPFFYHKKVLLYDFNLKEGDIVSTYTHGLNFKNNTVKKVDSVFAINRYLKRFVFIDSTEWIEGIGSTKELWYPAGSYLICVKENNELLYLNTALFNNCDTTLILTPPNNVYSLSNKIFEVNIFPNPINRKSQIIINSMNNPEFDIEIFNSLGVLIKKDNFKYIYQIGNLELKNGYYYCKIMSLNKQICFKKLIVAK